MVKGLISRWSSSIQSIAVRMQGRFPRQADDKNEIDNEISTDPSCV